MSKCSRCSSDIPEGIFVCPVCGLDVQLVPNYETIDLDMMIRHNDSAEKKIEQLVGKRKDRKRGIVISRVVIALCAFALVAATAIGVIVPVSAIKASLAADYDNFETAYNDALKLYEAGEYQDAYNAICTALEYDEDNVDALVLQARITYELENMDEALSILLVLIAADNTCEAAYEALAQIYADAGEFDNLAELMEDATEEIRQALSEYVVSAPEFLVEAGSYSEDQNVIISCDDGCDIYYSTDESAQFEDYTLYTDTLCISEGATTVYAVSVNQSGIRSKTVSKSYTVKYDVPDAPVILTSSGSYSGSNSTITIEAAEGCTIYYAVDSKPGTDSNVYTEPIQMTSGKHFVYAVAVNELGVMSYMSAMWYEYTETVAQTTTQTYSAPASSVYSSAEQADESDADNEETESEAEEDTIEEDAAQIEDAISDEAETEAETDTTQSTDESDSADEVQSQTDTAADEVIGEETTEEE